MISENQNMTFCLKTKKTKDEESKNSGIRAESDKIVL